jgi:hypothetical protein
MSYTPKELLDIVIGYEELASKSILKSGKLEKLAQTPPVVNAPIIRRPGIPPANQVIEIDEPVKQTPAQPVQPVQHYMPPPNYRPTPEEIAKNPNVWNEMHGPEDDMQIGDDDDEEEDTTPTAKTVPAQSAKKAIQIRESLLNKYSEHSVIYSKLINKYSTTSQDGWNTDTSQDGWHTDVPSNHVEEPLEIGTEKTISGKKYKIGPDRQWHLVVHHNVPGNHSTNHSTKAGYPVRKIQETLVAQDPSLKAMLGPTEIDGQWGNYTAQTLKSWKAKRNLSQLSDDEAIKSLMTGGNVTDTSDSILKYRN